jgi:hypothetical protein
MSFMSDNPKFTQAQIDAFLNKLTNWAKSLATNQRALLEQVLSQARGIPLSEDQLASVVGGLMALRDGNGGAWMHWAQRMGQRTMRYTSAIWLGIQKETESVSASDLTS